MSKQIGRNEPCWCGSGRKYKVCHAGFDAKIESYREQGHIVPPHHIIKTPAQIEQIKESCKINIAILDYLEEHIYEGMNTKEIDQIVYDMTTKRGGIPAPLNYEGFPYSVCTSVNDQVCHGFPSEDVILKSGDIVNVDCSTILNGYFSDSSRMFCIGEVSPEKKRLVQVTRECVKKGLEQVKPWGFLGDMGQAVHDHAAANGYTVVREIGGHGVGLEFHEEPWVGYHSKRGEEIPFIGYLLSKENERELAPVHLISFLTQKMLLIAIYERWNEVKVSDAAKRLEVSTKSASRCFDELEYLNIAVLGMKGKSRVIDIPDEREQLWQQIKNVLRNPVIRRFILREDIKFEKKAGLSALCEYSLLSDNVYPTYAVTKKELKDSGVKAEKQVSELEEIGCVVLELGYFIDFLGKGFQDPLSVVLSLTGDEQEEERVDISINEMLEEYVWSKD